MVSDVISFKSGVCARNSKRDTGEMFLNTDIGAGEDFVSEFIDNLYLEKEQVMKIQNNVRNQITFS